MARKPPTSKAARRKTAVQVLFPDVPKTEDEVVRSDHPAWEGARKRLEDHRKYSEHRMCLLFQYDVFKKEYEPLKSWLEGFVSAAFSFGRSKEQIESVVRKLPKIENFEKRWCVRVQVQFSSRGELGEFLVLDDIFMDQPRHLKADMLSDLAVEVGRDDERYILVDSRAPKQEIYSCLEYLLAQGMENRKRPFEITTDHEDADGDEGWDSVLVRNPPKRKKDCVAIAERMFPGQAKTAGVRQGALPIATKRVGNTALENFLNTVRQLWERWDLRLKYVIVPEEIAKNYPKKVTRFPGS